MFTLETERLLLRPWHDADRAPFAAMGHDPRVMAHFPALVSEAESNAMIDRARAATAERGFSVWPVELKESGEFIGFVGLAVPAAHFAFSPCVEIGWRLAHAHWGHGYASEAARAWLAWSFTERKLDEIVSFTSLPNTPSQAVMERIGMVRDADTFEHPRVEAGHPLRTHCLYRMGRARWESVRL
jgi:RimJ/RimL family protein N-acetyltransferase